MYDNQALLSGESGGGVVTAVAAAARPPQHTRRLNLPRLGCSRGIDCVHLCVFPGRSTVVNHVGAQIQQKLK